jgi:hypothetical protein
MKAALFVVLVAGLFAVTAARADQTTVPNAGSAPAISAATPDTASPTSPANGASLAPAPQAPEKPGTPPPTWANACVPTCDYYYNFCQEICGTRGIKSFTCTPATPCAHSTCTCNFHFP